MFLLIGIKNKIKHQRDTQAKTSGVAESTMLHLKNKVSTSEFSDIKRPGGSQETTKMNLAEGKLHNSQGVTVAYQTTSGYTQEQEGQVRI